MRGAGVYGGQAPEQSDQAALAAECDSRMAEREAADTGPGFGCETCGPDEFCPDDQQMQLAEEQADGQVDVGDDELWPMPDVDNAEIIVWPEDDAGPF